MDKVSKKKYRKIVNYLPCVYTIVFVVTRFWNYTYVPSSDVSLRRSSVIKIHKNIIQIHMYPTRFAPHNVRSVSKQSVPSWTCVFKIIFVWILIFDDLLSDTSVDCTLFLKYITRKTTLRNHRTDLKYGNLLSKTWLGP